MRGRGGRTECGEQETVPKDTRVLGMCHLPRPKGLGSRDYEALGAGAIPRACPGGTSVLTRSLGAGGQAGRAGEMRRCRSSRGGDGARPPDAAASRSWKRQETSSARGPRQEPALPTPRRRTSGPHPQEGHRREIGGPCLAAPALPAQRASPRPPPPTADGPIGRRGRSRG